jgi:hypothetical protein
MQITLQSDRYGNIYDAAFTSASYVSGVRFYEGFNEYFDASRIPYKTHVGIAYQLGIPTTTGASGSVGLRAHFSGSGFFETDLVGTYTRGTDYAVSFFISSSQNTSTQCVIAKASEDVTQWPFKIELSGSNQIVFSAAAASNLQAVVTSSALPAAWSHVVCQKSGSSLEIFVDTVQEASTAFTWLSEQVNSIYTASGFIHNDETLKIGGLSPVSSNYYGDLDEIRIFNKSLSASDISSLSDRTENGTFLQTNHVGNIFEKQGIVVISSPHYKYRLITTTPYTASYRSTITTYEYETLVRVGASDFNMSLNPSLLQDNAQDYKTFVSASSFGPYITSIGLYNDAGELLAVGKLAQPIQKRTDVDVNFVVRFDLDF